MLCENITFFNLFFSFSIYTSKGKIGGVFLEYNDFMEAMPEGVVKALQKGYAKRRVDVLQQEEEISEKELSIKWATLYKLISKSSAYINVYKNNKVETASFLNINEKHKDIIKTLSCCNDYNIYDGYLVPRYVTWGRCYTDHFRCEMDIMQLLLMMMFFKNCTGRNTICQMALDRVEMIKALSIQSQN